MVVVPLVLLLISCLVLVVSGGSLVKLLIKIASHLRLSDFVVSFIIMAFSTSIPELFVGINSALSGNPSLALGTVIGSNIADLTLVIGVAALFGSGIIINNQIIIKDSILMFLAALTPIVLIVFDHNLSRIDGIILISIFVLYMGYLIKERREVTEKPFEVDKKNHIAINILLFILCLGVLFISAHFVVIYATQLAFELALPIILVGLFLVAIGTSLPELVFEIHAVLAKRKDLAIGDAMGSVVCNSTLVLGITAVISPITGGFSLFVISAIFMILTIILFVFFVRNKNGISLAAAITLIILYVLFILCEYYFKSSIG